MPVVLAYRRVNLPDEAGWMTSRNIKLATGLVTALVLVGGGTYWRFVREIPVRIVVLQQNVEVRVFGIGTIEAQVVSKVGFQIAGKVIAVEADQGDVVKGGAPGGRHCRHPRREDFQSIRSHLFAAGRSASSVRFGRPFDT